MLTLQTGKTYIARNGTHVMITDEIGEDEWLASQASYRFRSAGGRNYTLSGDNNDPDLCLVKEKSTLMWDVYRAGRWVGMAYGDNEKEALGDITLEADRGPYKVIRWYGRKDPRNCVGSGGRVPDPT